jgi:hypothetical protein
MRTAVDYALDEASAANPPRKAASDGRDAGMDAQRLPSFPQPPGPAEKTSGGRLRGTSRG